MVHVRERAVLLASVSDQPQMLAMRHNFRLLGDGEHLYLESFACLGRQHIMNGRCHDEKPLVSEMLAGEAKHSRQASVVCINPL